LADSGYHCGWLQPLRIVRVNERFDNLPLAIDHKRPRDGQFKIGVTLRLRQINAGTAVEGMQVLWQLKHQPPLAGDLVTHIAEDVKAQRVFLHG